MRRLRRLRCLRHTARRRVATTAPAAAAPILEGLVN